MYYNDDQPLYYYITKHMVLASFSEPEVYCHAVVEKHSSYRLTQGCAHSGWQWSAPTTTQKK